jgi:two-component system NtrC family sensor kinase
MEVTDNGAGIEESEMKSIFEPFYTTKTTGSGLGLFYSQRLIKEMGGNITVESQKGGPTIFRVFLARSEKG